MEDEQVGQSPDERQFSTEAEEAQGYSIVGLSGQRLYGAELMMPR